MVKKGIGGEGQTGYDGPILMRNMQWARLLAYVTGMVNQRLLLQNEYLTAENRILRAHLPNRLRISDDERSTLAEIGKRLGRSALRQVANVAKPETILAWYRRLIARKFDGSMYRQHPGRPRVGRDVAELVVRMARENPLWGYDRIAGALSNLGHEISDQTVGNILRRFGIAPAPKRRQSTTWSEFIRSHMAVMAGIDFFTVEVLTLAGLGHLLRAVLSAFGNETSNAGGDHPAPHCRVDGTDG
jgi:transposase